MLSKDELDSDEVYSDSDELEIDSDEVYSDSDELEIKTIEDFCLCLKEYPSYKGRLRPDYEDESNALMEALDVDDIKNQIQTYQVEPKNKNDGNTKKLTLLEFALERFSSGFKTKETKIYIKFYIKIILKIIKNHESLITTKGGYGSALHAALHFIEKYDNGEKDIIYGLINIAGNQLINLTDDDGYKPLYYHYLDKNPCLRILEIFSEYNCFDINSALVNKPEENDTVLGLTLAFCAENNSFEKEIVSYLIQHNANPSANYYQYKEKLENEENEETTALHYAARWNDYSILKLLLNSSLVDINKKDR